ncbi:MAG TPA: diacylglycerol kinase family protein, partial [Limnochordia bacterium]|nr:diacylglycerol kinase family protein [Limnochordia bacterium]
ERLWPRLAARLGERGDAFERVRTTRPGDAGRLAAQAQADGYDRIIAIGGDGTLQETIDGLLRAAATAQAAGPTQMTPAPAGPVGWIPAGTGNDFARSTGIPTDPLQALTLALDGEPHPIDVGQINGTYFLNVAGAGFDAKVAARVNRMRLRLGGLPTYLLAVLCELWLQKNAPLVVRWDGRSKRINSFLIAVGNAQYYGGGIRMCPGAQLDDGLLDVCIGGDFGRLEALRALTRTFSGRHVALPKVEVLKAKTLRIDGPPDLPIHADGQTLGTLPAEIRVCPGALGFIAPRQAPIG